MGVVLLPDFCQNFNNFKAGLRTGALYFTYILYFVLCRRLNDSLNTLKSQNPRGGGAVTD